MADVFVHESSLTAIADAIREKLNTEDTYKPGEMADAISSISGGGSTPTINSLSVTENGTYTAPSGVDGYSPVTVNVPQGTTPTGTKQISITENGTTIEDVTNYANAEITVNVSGGSSNNFASGSFQLETGVTTYTFDTGIDYDYLVLFEDGGTGGDGTRFLRIITNNFTLSSAQNRTIVTTNNSGTGVAGFYFTNATWGSKSGTSFTYTSQSNNTKLGAGVIYRWVAWKVS